MNKIKKISEVILLSLIIIIALWLGAFLLRDKSELFCKMSLGELRTFNLSNTPSLSKIDDERCVGTWIVDTFGN